MLRTNLSTRPFYNERAVHVALGLVALVVLALTATIGPRPTTSAERPVRSARASTRTS